MICRQDGHQLNTYSSPLVGQMDWLNHITGGSIDVQSNVDFQAEIMLQRQGHKGLVGFLVETMMH